MLIDKPLSLAEIDELDDFMTSDAVPVDCMDLSELHGFLTAVEIWPGARRRTPPRRWRAKQGRARNAPHCAAGAHGGYRKRQQAEYMVFHIWKKMQ